MGIVDGDTIKVRLNGRTERVRVIGIDTPELRDDECYARQASSRMQSLAQSRSLRLEADPTQDDRDRYGRLLRHVILADDRSAAEVLIDGGYGREYTYRDPYTHRDAHLAAQTRARAAGRGLWGACPATPATASTPASSTAEPRTESPRRSDAKAPTPASQEGSCDIKGNINREGEKIYHVPGGRSYAKTRIDESSGERMFCSTAEAESAGWRAARD